MNLLLDTHIWLWSHFEPGRIGKRAREAMQDADSRLWLSPISVWEFLLLCDRGRLKIKEGLSPTDWLEAVQSRVPMQDAPLTREVAIRSRSLRIAHGDPADRFLAATADVYGLTLVTADEHLLRGKGYRTLASR